MGPSWGLSSKAQAPEKVLPPEHLGEALVLGESSALSSGVASGPQGPVTLRVPCPLLEVTSGRLLGKWRKHHIPGV